MKNDGLGVQIRSVLALNLVCEINDEDLTRDYLEVSSYETHTIRELFLSPVSLGSTWQYSSIVI